MRILAIRGCNLASLAGEFEIDLARAPLGGAGVFAIVGNTGAGKSTLLDAMCAALFDRTPRLSAPSRVQVGRGPEDPLALGANDVRTLLRRGASAGWAEVDFESGDAKRYRARWSVRRARGSAMGTLQDQQISLVALDGNETLGGTKTETLKAIQQRLGLSFDQFRRSALLAQGDFATFLKADGKDRSELLERMTGTEIYSRLSIAAHLRAANAEAKLREGRAMAHAVSVLFPEARAALEISLATAVATRTTARDELAVAEAVVRTATEAARLEAELVTARAAHGAAVTAVAGAALLRDELAIRRRAEDLRPTWDAAARLVKAHAASGAALVAASHAADFALATRDRHTARRASLSAALAPVRGARMAAGLVERPAPASIPAGHLEARAASDADWLVARAGLAAEVAAWPDLEQKLAQHAAATDALTALEREVVVRLADRQRLVTAHSAAAAGHQEALGALELAQRKAAGFRERRSTLSLDAARRQEDDARTRCVEVARLATIADAARTNAESRVALERESVALDGGAAADRDARLCAVAAKDAADGVRKTHQRDIEALRRVSGYAHARTELVEGEECPLCGATEHPWAAKGEMSAAIRHAERLLAQESKRLDAAIAEIAAISAREAARTAERARVASRRTMLDHEATAVAAQWREQLGALGELLLVDDPADPSAPTLAAERIATANAALEAARQSRSHVEASVKAAADAQQHALARQVEVDDSARRLAELERARRDVDSGIERMRGELGARTSQRADLASAITAALSRWLVPSPETRLRETVTHSLPANLARARDAIAGFVEAWRRSADAVGDAEALLSASLATLDRALAESERELAEATARRDEASARHAALSADLSAANEALASSSAAASLDAPTLASLLSSPASRIDDLTSQLAALDRAVDLTRAVVVERERHLASQPVSTIDVPGAQALLVAARTAFDAAESLATQLSAELRADDLAQSRKSAALAALTALEAAHEVDRILGEAIGSHDGKLFRSFAQSLTLDSLLSVANAHLEELAPRYQLQRVPRHDLELQVIDRDLGGEIRSVQSLSGGESFLVSLALALGLSSMSAHDVRVRTLLIDEGFGTLDPSTLDVALAVLDRLQATGRQVGVISHVPALVERVGAHVRIIQRGGGRSEVLVSDSA